MSRLMKDLSPGTYVVNPDSVSERDAGWIVGDYMSSL